jgi:hypothetical protein
MEPLARTVWKSSELNIAWRLPELPISSANWRRAGLSLRPAGSTYSWTVTIPLTACLRRLLAFLAAGWPDYAIPFESSDRIMTRLRLDRDPSQFDECFDSESVNPQEQPGMVQELLSKWTTWTSIFPDKLD